MSELRQFKLPDVGEGLTEAEIVKWHVQPGDAVTINQIIVDIETAKAVVELPSPYEGVVADLLVPEGESADVGVPIISVRVGADAGSGDSGQPGAANGLAAPPAEGAIEPGIHGSPAPKAEPAGERQAVLVGYGVKLGATKRRPRKSGAAKPAAVVPAAADDASSRPLSRAQATVAQTPELREPEPSPPEPSRVVVLAKPPVRKLAKDLGVDLTRVTGTGPQGSITRADVQAAAGPAAEPAALAYEPAAQARAVTGLTTLPREERIAIRGVRKHTAAAVAASAFTAPHVTEFLQIDITETMTAARRLRELPDFADVRVSPLLLVAKALLVAAARHPMINSAWDEAAQEIVVKHYVNLGIAAATDRGLVVPNVKDAHALNLPDLARALAQLAETARAGKATPADLSGGTISITNVGIFGVDTGTPILPVGEAAILAFGQVKDAPWVVDGELAVRKVCTLALSFDHRLVDGDLGSAVLRDVGAMLTDPLRMLAWS
jgi:2-oxoisovalerate dehydrogenase E2 component (dihydrolipoyl transacylase)